MNIIQCMEDPQLFHPWFVGSSWAAWNTALKGAFALPMTKTECRLFRTLAGREPPRKPVRECWFIIGRRGGKDSVASLMGTYAAPRPRRVLYVDGEMPLVSEVARCRSQPQAQSIG